MNDREDLYRSWVAWVTTNLGRDTRLTEIAASSATDAAAQGLGFNSAAEAARTAWSDAAKRYSVDRRWWWDGTRWEPLTPAVSAAGLREHHWWIIAIGALLVVAVEWIFSMGLTGTKESPRLSPHDIARAQCQSMRQEYPPDKPCAISIFDLADSGRISEVLWSDLGSQACQSVSVGIREPEDVSEQQLAADLLQAGLKFGVIRNACGGGDVYGYSPGTGPRGPYTLGHVNVRTYPAAFPSVKPSGNFNMCFSRREVYFYSGSVAHPGNAWTVSLPPQPGDICR